MGFPEFVRIATLHSEKKEIANSDKKNETIAEKKVVLDFFDTELISILAKKLRFSYEIVVPNDGEYGTQLPGGNWSGQVGMLLQNEADLVIHQLAVTEERNKVIGFSYPYFISRLTFATKNLEPTFSKTAFLEVFSLKIWIFIIISFILMFIMSALFKRVFSIVHNSGMFRQNAIGNIYIGQTICKIGFDIGQIFLRMFYSALLLSVLSAPSLVGVRTIAELGTAVMEGKYRCVTTPGAYTADTFLKNSKSGDFFNIIGQSLKENKGNMNFEEVLDDTQSSVRPAFITFELRFLAYKEFYFISDEGFFIDFKGIGLRKDFCCTAELDVILHQLWSSGISMKIINDALTIRIIKNEQRISVTNIVIKKLSIQNLEGVFILLLAGYSLSTIVFLIEILFSKFFSCCNLRKK